VNGAFPTVTFVNSTQLKVPVTAAQIATPGAFQVWVGNSPTAATCDAFAALPFTVANNPIVVSRMTHGSAGTFDVNLPFAGTRGVECRSGGANGNYTIVFQFANSLTSVGGASVTSGPGSVSSSAIGVNKNEYIVNLTGVIPPNPPGGAYVTVTLTNVLDSANNSGTVVGPQMGVLVGDVDASGRVDSTDTFDVRQDSLQTISSSNFRADVDASGRIDSNDVFVTRQQSLTSLPSLP
jgi:hypothetical protein